MSGARPAVADRPRARRRRAEPDRLADLVVSAGGTMNREAVALWHARLHDLRRAARRRRRGADPLRPAAAADRPSARSSWSKRRAASGRSTAATRRCWSRLILGTVVSARAAATRRRVPPPRRSPGARGDDHGNESLAGATPASRTPRGRAVDAVLRTFDIAISGRRCSLLCPLSRSSAAATLVTSGRPVLYRGDRVGRAGHVFTMYKFRTLAADAETRLGPYSARSSPADRGRADAASAGSCARPTSTRCRSSGTCCAAT